MLDLFTDEEALRQTNPDEIAELTRRATAATYFTEDLGSDEVDFIDRVVRISSDSVASAARNPHQHLVTASAGGRLAGFVIATLHAEDSRELDWLMVDPQFHGTAVAAPLMRAGMAWLGVDQPMWLNVVRHNERAIRFYRKHGFEIDPEADCPHVMPHWIMRRPADR
jgi:ribosomal protein S18 acetylase RimI-like enzyme